MLSIVFRLVRFTRWLTIHQCHLQVNSESKCFCPFDLITIFHNDSMFIGIFFFFYCSFLFRARTNIFFQSLIIICEPFFSQLFVHIMINTIRDYLAQPNTMGCVCVCLFDDATGIHRLITNT